MKKIINSILFLFAISIFLSSNVFAAAPIPGICVVVKRNPGAIIPNVTTDNNGKFSYELTEGNYDLTISYNEIINAVSETDKNKNSGKVSYEITLMLDGGAGVMVQDKTTPAKITITERTGNISFSIPNGGGTISGTLTYVATSPKETSSNIIMSVSKISLDFGEVKVGETSTRKVTITNSETSDSPLMIKWEYGISQPGIKIAVNDVFSISPSGTVSIAPGKSQEFTIKFSPVKEGSFKQTISFLNNSKNQPVYSDVATGLASGKRQHNLK